MINCKKLSSFIKKAFIEKARQEIPICAVNKTNKSTKGNYLYTKADTDNDSLVEDHIIRDTMTDQLGQTLGESRYHEKDKIEFFAEPTEKKIEEKGENKDKENN